MAETVAELVELLLPGFGSFTAEDTVAVFVMVEPFVALVFTLYVDRMITDCPPVRVPRLQGKAVVHAPELETNVAPVGVGSVTVTPVASLGPLFVTVMV